MRVIVAQDDPVRRADRVIVRTANRLVGRWPLLDAALVQGAAHSAKIEALLLIGLALRGLPGRDWRSLLDGVRASVALVLTIGAVEIVGQVARRNRPFAVEEQVVGLLAHKPGRSFPSRHVACAAALAAASGHAAPAIGRAMAWLGVLLAVSRVYTGLHYPSDVAAGWLLGEMIGRLVRLARRPARRSGHTPSRMMGDT